eukprot:CAMPEP_0171992550 /NCGR_PEP_ID=MMETSP0993-20121228/277997_1 /TAXON_ID=483369 /ORGANISM="non described non described, Strain CCMP2098" /LENGTH=331 /DNA_ID=CAMNT_0012645597 /DNA_START=60 /DNA_END=1052 /DNA_ORIENTATION=-
MSKLATRVFPVPGGPRMREAVLPRAHATAACCEGFAAKEAGESRSTAEMAAEMAAETEESNSSPWSGVADGAAFAAMSPPPGHAQETAHAPPLRKRRGTAAERASAVRHAAGSALSARSLAAFITFSAAADPDLSARSFAAFNIASAAVDPAFSARSFAAFNIDSAADSALSARSLAAFITFSAAADPDLSARSFAAFNIASAAVDPAFSARSFAAFNIPSAAVDPAAEKEGATAAGDGGKGGRGEAPLPKLAIIDDARRAAASPATPLCTARRAARWALSGPLLGVMRSSRTKNVPGLLRASHRPAGHDEPTPTVSQSRAASTTTHSRGA